jgi:mannose-6-phosphate isomerase-like protein (cupin superfamily)
MPIIDDILERARRNSYFREVVSTGPHCQVVVMSLKPDESIGEEIHQGVDQVFVFVEGIGEAVLDGERHPVQPGRLVHVMAGVRHDVVNTGTQDLRLYTVYAPAQHAPGTVHETRAQADAAEHALTAPIP